MSTELSVYIQYIHSFPSIKPWPLSCTVVNCTRHKWCVGSDVLPQCMHILMALPHPSCRGHLTATDLDLLNGVAYIWHWIRDTQRNHKLTFVQVLYFHSVKLDEGTVPKSRYEQWSFIVCKRAKRPYINDKLPLSYWFRLTPLLFCVNHYSGYNEVPGSFQRCICHVMGHDGTT